MVSGRHYEKCAAEVFGADLMVASLTIHTPASLTDTCIQSLPGNLRTFRFSSAPPPFISHSSNLMLSLLASLCLALEFDFPFGDGES